MRVLPNKSRPFKVNASLKALSQGISDAGGRAILVGGAVRDHLLGIENKDIDVEVFGLSLDDTEKVLRALGRVHEVGRSFGVFKVSLSDEEEAYDVALPRRENKSGQGHRGFEVEHDLSLTFEDAVLRRDFTINALGIDIESGALLDPTGGVRDLEAGLLRHVSDAFAEDPLRVLRGCQFAARFDLRMHESTLKMCRSLKDELQTLARERLFSEMQKLLVKARFPSVGLNLLHDTHALSLFPELQALRGCVQEAEWHPEGDVWVHTLMVTDQAAHISRRDNLDAEETLRVVLGALCHDLGKPSTTIFEDGRWRSKNHEAKGEAPTRAFLERLAAPHALIDDVVALVVDHLKPFQLYAERDHIKDGAIRRLALRVSIERLVRVSEADFLGRTTPEALNGIDPAKAWLLERAEVLRVQSEKPKPLILGRHLIERGHKPGKSFKGILEAVFAAQLDGVFSSLDEGLVWLDANLQNLAHDLKDAS